MDPFGFDSQFWALQSSAIPGFPVGCQTTTQPMGSPHNYVVPHGDLFPLISQAHPSMAYMSGPLSQPPANSPSPASTTCSDSAGSMSPHPPGKNIQAAASPPPPRSSSPSSSSSSLLSRRISSTSSKRRRRATITDPGEFDEEEDAELPPPLGPNATEEERSVWLRQRNTIQARRNRKRRLIRFQQLEGDVEELSLSREMWKARACTLKEILAGHGLPCPEWS